MELNAKKGPNLPVYKIVTRDPIILSNSARSTSVKKLIAIFKCPRKSCSFRATSVVEVKKHIVKVGHGKQLNSNNEVKNKVEDGNIRNKCNVFSIVKDKNCKPLVRPNDGKRSKPITPFLTIITDKNYKQVVRSNVLKTERPVRKVRAYEELITKNIKEVRRHKRVLKLVFIGNTTKSTKVDTEVITISDEESEDETKKSPPVSYENANEQSEVDKEGTSSAINKEANEESEDDKRGTSSTIYDEANQEMLKKAKEAEEEALNNIDMTSEKFDLILQEYTPEGPSISHDEANEDILQKAKEAEETALNNIDMGSDQFDLIIKEEDLPENREEVVEATNISLPVIAYHHCPNCSYTSPSDVELQDHFAATHKPLECKHCKFVTLSSTLMDKHFEAKHGAYCYYSCPDCAFISGSKTILSNHLIDKHSICQVKLSYNYGGEIVQKEHYVRNTKS